MPRKFDQESKDRVVRLVEDRILADNMSMQAACKIVAPKLGVSWHIARQWTQARSSRGTCCGINARGLFPYLTRSFQRFALQQRGHFFAFFFSARAFISTRPGGRTTSTIMLSSSGSRPA
ncbi:transposase-like protein [Corynebacterium diphtheriae BH8]|nr:transposase-like protein [Corynebacterium diphtheriae BH8]